MKSSMRRASFGVTYSFTSKPWTSPPMRTGKAETSKRVMGPMPLRPLRIASHAAGTVLPTGETMPSPVTTTRRLLNQLCPSDFGPALVDVVDGLMHRRDLLRIFVRDLDLEFLFERHHQLDRIQRVCTQVVDEGGIARDLFLLDTQLFGDDGFYLLFDRAH